MDDSIQQGITAYRAGKRDEARKYFTSAIKQNQNDERAWGWMYNVCENDKERVYCLQQIVRVNPENKQANQLLKNLIAIDLPVTQPEAQKPLPTKPITTDKQTATMPKTLDPKQQKNVIITIGTLLFICVICLCIFLTSGNGGKKDYSTMASVQCKNYVRDRLKSPSTAEFPFMGSSVINAGNETYEVKSYVDAQNSFGAVVRNYYFCKIQYTGGDEADRSNWILLQLDISE